MKRNNGFGVNVISGTNVDTVVYFLIYDFPGPAAWLRYTTPGLRSLCQLTQRAQSRPVQRRQSFPGNREPVVLRPADTQARV